MYWKKQSSQSMNSVWQEIDRSRKREILTASGIVRQIVMQEGADNETTIYNGAFMLRLAEMISTTNPDITTQRNTAGLYAKEHHLNVIDEYIDDGCRENFERVSKMIEYRGRKNQLCCNKRLITWLLYSGNDCTSHNVRYIAMTTV